MKADYIYYGTEIEAVREYVSEIGLLEGVPDIAKYYFDYGKYADDLKHVGVRFETYRMNGTPVTCIDFRALGGV